MTGWICVHTIVELFSSFEQFIPWIALLLLGYIGGKMLLEGIKGEETEEAAELSAGALFVQGVATSIDALSVGFTISEYGWLMALVCSLIIAIVTFFICEAGLSIGRKFGTKLSGKASILGGVTILAAIRKITGLNAMLVGSGMKTGLNILMDNPKSVGSDMIVNAVGALAEHEPPIIIIEMGTATTMSVIDKNGRYVGGAILPGLRVSLDSMSASTAQLPRISLDTPRRVIGKNTIDCMRSGVIFGNAAMIDGMLDRIEEELGEKTSIIATGGISKIVLPLCSHTITYDGALLMKGLLHLYEKNRRTE